ncbi:Lactation elevated protein 1 [Hordeum vulgare]|nr:Lactation elevated protein 1 [Hordeum vulgare]
MPAGDNATVATNVFYEMGASGTAEFVHLLDDNTVDIEQAPINHYDYNELDGGVHDHGEEEDGVVKVDKAAFDQEQAKKEKILQESQKWELIEKESPSKRGSLTEMDDDGPRNNNKPNGNKKAKDKIKRESEASGLRDKIYIIVQTNEVLAMNTLKTKKELAEKKAQEKQKKWLLLKVEGLRKAAIEDRKALAGENKALAKLLAEQNKIIDNEP